MNDNKIDNMRETRYHRQQHSQDILSTRKLEEEKINFQCNNDVDQVSVQSCKIATTSDTDLLSISSTYMNDNNITTFTKFQYTLFNMDYNICINSEYLTDGSNFITAQVCMKPYKNNNNNNNTTTNPTCTICFYYECDIQTMIHQYDTTNLEQYCHRNRYIMISETQNNDFSDCKSLITANTFNRTMPTIIWSSVYENKKNNNNKQVHVYSLQILDAICDAGSLQLNNKYKSNPIVTAVSMRNLYHTVVVIVVLGVCLIVLLQFVMLFRTPSKNRQRQINFNTTTTSSTCSTLNINKEGLL